MVRNSSPLPILPQPKRPDQSSRYVRTISLPVLVITLAVLLISGPSLYFWHAYQVKRTASSLLARANQISLAAAEQGDDRAAYADAAELLFRYTRLRPDDSDAEVQLAEIYRKTAGSAGSLDQAITLTYRALTVAESDQQDALRRSLCDLLLKRGRYTEAEEEIRKVISQTGTEKAWDDFEILRLFALTMFGQYRTGTLRNTAGPTSDTQDLFTPSTRNMLEALRRAVALTLQPSANVKPDSQLTATLANLLRDTQDARFVVYPPGEPSSAPMGPEARAAEADQLMDKLVDVADQDAVAWVARAAYRSQHDLPGAQDDIAKALELDGADLTIRLAAAAVAQSEADNLLEKQGWTQLPDESAQDRLPEQQIAAAQQARRLFQDTQNHCQYVLDNIDSVNETALVGLGRAAIMLGDAKKAVDIWSQAVKDSERDSLTLRFLLAQTCVNEGLLEQAEEHLAALDKHLSRFRMQAEQRQIASILRSVALMQAQIKIGQADDYREALRLLGIVSAGRPTSKEEAREHFIAQRLSGLCRLRLGEPDLAAACFEAAAQLAGTPADQIAMRLAAADAWSQAGATDQAINNCRRAQNLVTEGLVPEVNLQLAQLFLARLRMLPPESRDFRDFHEVMQPLRELTDTDQIRNSWRIALYDAEAQWMQASREGDPAAAAQAYAQTAQQLEERFSDDPELLDRLAQVYQQLDRPEDADRVADAFARVAPDPMAAHLLQAGLHVQRGQYDAALAVLPPQSPETLSWQNGRIDRLRADILVQANKLEEAQQQLEALRKTYPQDDSVLGLLLSLAQQKGDAAAEKALTEALLGSGDTASRVRQLIVECQEDGDRRVTEALELLKKLETSRPDSAQPYLLRGLLAEKRATFAANAARAAKDSGEDPAPDEQAEVQYLRQAVLAYEESLKRNRFGEANERLVLALLRLDQKEGINEKDRLAQHLAQIDSLVPRSANLTRAAIGIALQSGDTPRALDFARRAVEARPQDVAAQVEYGLLLLSARQPKEAEAILTAAVNAAPKNEVAWNGLFTFHARTRNETKALQTLDKMVDQVPMTAARKSYVKAQGYQELGKDQEAEQAYREAVEQADDSTRLAMQKQLAQFYVQRAQQYESGYLEKAIALLEQIRQSDPDDETFTQLFAAAKAVSGAEGMQEAMEVVGKGGTRYKRLGAMLRFQRGGDENLALALRDFQELAEAPGRAVSDLLMVARIQELLGDIESARKTYADLSQAEDVTPLALRYHIDFLLRQEDLDAAEQCLAQLEQVLKAGSQAVPLASELGVLQLRARLLAAQDRLADVPSLVEDWADDRLKQLPETGDARATLINQIGDIYTAVELYDKAEPWYRALLKQDSRRIAPLALCLANQDRIGEAIEICTQDKLNESQIAQVVAGALTTGKPTQADFDRAEPYFASALEKFPNDSGLLQRISSVRIIQGNTQEAVELLRKTVELEPRNVLALNNLAMILSEQPDSRAQAIEYIDQAIEITGPRPDLYDSKGAILLYDHRPEEAIPLLEFAVKHNQRDPRFRFHLAAAYHGVGRMDEAARYYREAIDGNLEGQILTVPDRELMADMQDLLNPPASVPAGAKS